MPNAIAIDFGTSRTKLAYWNAGSHRPDLMRFYRDDPYLPSLFYLARASEGIFWGHDAEAMLEKDAAGVIDVLKRKLREPVVRANRRKVTPIELLALLFRALREHAGREIVALAGTLPQQVSLTIPALYGPPDERVLREAAVQAGFGSDQIAFVPEPVAAARAWLAETGATSQDVVVLDCGGGTIDWAYLRREGEDFGIVPDCPPGGDRHVGGHDVDLELLNVLKDKLDGEMDDEIEAHHFEYLQQVRALKERYCRGLPLYPLKIGAEQIQFTEADIQAVLRQRFVNQTCENLKSYLDKIRTVNSTTLPPILLVGGSAWTKGLKEAIEIHCGCSTVWWERSEYATVLGAVPPAPRSADPITRYQYRLALEMAWADKKLEPVEVDRLSALRNQLGLTAAEAAQIEREVLGDVRELLLGQQRVNTQPPSVTVPAEPISVRLSTPASGPLTVNVAADGSGDYPTLERALAAVPEGSTLRLLPGEHRLKEPLLIEKAVRLIGAGMEATTIVGYWEECVIKFTGPGRLTALNMTFRHEGGTWANAVVVTGGEVQLTNCRFTGGVGDGPEVGVGLVLLGSLQGSVSHCRMDGNRACGIAVIGQAQPTLEENTCEGNKAVGIGYWGSAGGVARANRCTGNALHGIYVSEQAQPTLEDNVCEGNKQDGILYKGRAGGTARKNRCSSNECQGIEVSKQAQPTLEANAFERNKGKNVLDWRL